MSARPYYDPNAELIRVLGITQKNITSAEISLRPGVLPLVKLECMLAYSTGLHEVQLFDLVPHEAPPAPAADPTPLDLDAMCAAARQRVANAATQAAAQALQAHLAESKAIRQRMRDACGRYSVQARVSIGWCEMGPWLANLAGTLAAAGGSLFSGGTSASGGLDFAKGGDLTGYGLMGTGLAGLAISARPQKGGAA